LVRIHFQLCESHNAVIHRFGVPALTGVDLGFRTFVVVDACGGISERTEEAALRRVTSHGGSTTCVMTLAGELAGDFQEETGQKAIEILFPMARK
jgi:hypothetical protein